MAKNVVIVLTDGQSNDRTQTIKEAQKLHVISDDVISIAIGQGKRNRNHVYTQQPFENLISIYMPLLNIFSRKELFIFIVYN